MNASPDERRELEASADLGYEQRDLTTRTVVIAVGSLVLVLLASVAGMIGVFRLLTPAAPAPEAGSIWSGEPYSPPEPRLQVQPGVDLVQMRHEQNTRLNNYGWIDREAGIAHIPITRAMEIVAEQGVPSWSNETK